jgi:hypothetical protein
MSILTPDLAVAGEQSHTPDYLAPSVLFADREHRQHWGSLNGNYVVDGRNFLVVDARVDYEPTAYVSVPGPGDVPNTPESPVPEPAMWFVVGLALLAAVIRRRMAV